MTVNPRTAKCRKTFDFYSVYAWCHETMTERFIGITRKDPRGWVIQSLDRPDEWLGTYGTRAEAVHSLVWRVNRTTVA